MEGSGIYFQQADSFVRRTLEWRKKKCQTKTKCISFSVEGLQSCYLKMYFSSFLLQVWGDQLSIDSDSQIFHSVYPVIVILH